MFLVLVITNVLFTMFALLFDGLGLSMNRFIMPPLHPPPPPKNTLKNQPLFYYLTVGLGKLPFLTKKNPTNLSTIWKIVLNFLIVTAFY